MATRDPKALQRMNSISVFIGQRLSFRTPAPDGTLEKRSSPGVVIAVGGIALSMIIMLISIAVVSGFKNELKKKITGFNSQITVYSGGNGIDRISPIKLGDLRGSIERVMPDAGISAAVDLSGVIKTDKAFQGLMIKGVSDGNTRSFIASQITKGRMWDKGENALVVSAATANALGIDTGESVYAHFFVDDDLKTRKLTVTGIFDTHFTDYDKKMAFADIGVVGKIANLDSTECTVIEINGIDNSAIDEMSGKLSEVFLSDALISRSGFVPVVDNVNRSGASYLSWLDLLDTNVVVILVLMALVAGFTLISSLFILILERVRMIGILKSLGASNRQVRGIFIYMAERLVVRGMIAGNALGLGLIFLQNTTHAFPLDADAYYLSYVPAEIGWISVVVLNLSVIIVTSLILILPSQMISSLSPAESMRYE